MHFLLYVFLLMTYCAVLCLVTQSCQTLWDPMDCGPPGSSDHGDFWGENTGVGCPALLQACPALFQGIFPTKGSNPGLPHCRGILYHLSYLGNPRIMEWVAYPFSGGSSRPGSPALQMDSLPAELPGKPLLYYTISFPALIIVLWLCWKLLLREAGYREFYTIFSTSMWV